MWIRRPGKPAWIWVGTLWCAIVTLTVVPQVFAAPPTVASVEQADVDQEVSQLIDQVEADDQQLRAEAIVRLGELGEEAASTAELLVEQLADTKGMITVGNIGSAIAGHAERALVCIGTSAGPALVEGLAHKNLEVRRRAAEVLGEIRDARAIDPLIELLGDADPELTNHARTALGKIGTPAVEPLLEVLITGSKEQRLGAAGALGQTRSPKAIEPLVAALREDDELLILWSLHALQNNLTDSSRDILARPEIAQQLLAALKSDSKSVQDAVSGLLIQVAANIVDALLAALDDPDLRVRNGAVRALFVVHDQRVVKPLLRIAGESAGEPSIENVERKATALTSLTHSIGTLDQPADVLNVALPLLGHESYRLRRAAASTIGQVAQRWPEEKRPVAPLIAALASETERSSLHTIIQSLSEFRDPRAVDPLLAILERAEIIRQWDDTPRDMLTQKQQEDSDHAIRDQVAWAVGRIGDPRAMPALRKLLPLERRAVLESLGMLHDRESVPHFIAALRLTDRWTPERIEWAAAAANALAATPDERAIPALLESAKMMSQAANFGRDPFGQLRREVCNALSATGDARAVDALLQLSQTEPLWPQFNEEAELSVDDLDSEISNRPASWPLFGLGLVALPRLIEELSTTSRLGADGTSSVDRTRAGREVAAWVLENLFLHGDLQPGDGDEAIPVLMEALQDHSHLVRLCALRALGHLKAKPAVPAILTLVDDLSAADRQREASSISLLNAAASALSWIGDERAAGMAERLLAHPSSSVREAAVFAVLASKHPRTVELLLPLLNEHDEELRETAIRQLGFVNDRRIGAPLVLLLRPEHPHSTRAMAAQSLGLLGDRAAADALANSIAEGDPKVRLHAAVALLQLSDDRGLEPVRKLLEDASPDQRVECLQHLSLVTMFANHIGRSRIEHLAARRLLLQVVETDPDARVRSSGMGALRGSSEEATVALLLSLAKDPSEWVRREALIVLAETHDFRRFETFLAALQDEKPRVRRTAALNLGKVAALPDIPVLINALRDADPDVREAILIALSEQKVSAASEIIAELGRSDPSPKVRVRAQRVARALSSK